MPEGSDVLFVVLNSVFAFLVLFTNSIVIIVIIKSRELHLPTLWNIAFMAAFLVFIVPSKIAGAFVYPEILGHIGGRLLAYIITQNIINIIIALVDRYLSICWSLHYQRIMSPKRFTCAVTIGFLVNLLRLCILLTTVNNDITYNKVLGYFTSTSKKTGASVSGVFALVALGIIIGFLIRIRLELRKTRSNRGGPQSVSTQFTYTMYLSTLVYTVNYMPIAITLVIEMITGEKNYEMMQIGMTCILSNSLLNVFIYAVTYQPFRDALLRVFCPTFSRERARREVRDQYRKNSVNVFTVDDAQY